MYYLGATRVTGFSPAPRHRVFANMLLLSLLVIGVLQKVVGDPLELRRQRTEKVVFLFVSEHGDFPHLKTWQVFFAGAPDSFSIYVLTPAAPAQGSKERTKLLAIGATVLTMPTGDALNLKSPSFGEAIRGLLRVAMEEQPSASRFCLLPAESTPLYHYSVVHRKMLADPRSSVDACRGPSDSLTIAGQEAGGAHPWAILSTSSARVVVEGNATAEGELERFCASQPPGGLETGDRLERNPRHRCVAAAHLIPTLLHARAMETDCSGRMIRTQSILNKIPGRRPEVMVASDLMRARTGKGCHATARRNGTAKPHCPLFWIHDV
jgi:hypothetical protein